MSTSAIEIQPDLVFGKTDRNEDLKADVYLPHVTGEHPAVLLIHGGAWRHGEKEEYREWGPLLAQAGFVAVAINYRLSTSEYAIWPGALDEVRHYHGWYRHITLAMLALAYLAVVRSHLAGSALKGGLWWRSSPPTTA